MSDDAQTGIFLNGKAQIIEMLPYMTQDERNILIKNVRSRNPQLADELAENSVTFSNIVDLDDHDLQVVLNYVKAPIMGIALKGLNSSQQRRVLSVAPRQYAEEAFKVMNIRLSNETRDIKRAHEKVKKVMGSLLSRKAITFH
jgi:flagellar motor switch protein FliG